MNRAHSAFLAALVALMAIFVLPYSWVAWAAPALRTIGILAAILGAVAFALVVLHTVVASVDTDELTTEHHWSDR